MAISRSGLDVEWQRLQLIAQNLANMGTSRSASGEVYAPLRMITGPRGEFANLLSDQPGGVQIKAIEAMRGQVRRVHEPGNPNADANGFVTYPDIDQAGEMTMMIKTARAYEANLVALGIAQQMYSKALEFGRTG
ncbi:flagellar basal body rod protein FlgC [Novosphingopyxis sp.]|uniref:flagellar basal body rod protein FlgC n=1 Tax=Novosphingopyxis sp. TaxID=2709690 RepID=UPI003B5C497B